MKVDFNNFNKFDTIKSKVTAVFTIITVLFFFAITILSYTYFHETKKLILTSYSNYVAEIAQILDKGMNIVEHNATDVAEIAKSFYYGQINEKTTKEYLTSILMHYKEPQGEGIWFKPYIFNNQKYKAIYAMRQKNGDIDFLDIYNTDEYNYFKKSWYKHIALNVTPESNIVWTLAVGDYTPSNLLITAGVGIFDNDGQLLGIAEVDWDFNVCIDILNNVKPTPNSFALFADKKQNYVFLLTDTSSNSKNIIGKSLSEVQWYNDKLQEGVPFKYNGKEYIPFIKILPNNMMLIVNIPKYEILGTLYSRVIFLILILSILSLMLIFLLYLTLSKDIMSPINKLILIAHKIMNGDLVAQIKIEKPAEFALLASTYDKMTDNIKQITTKQTRMNYELSIANSIQISSLPNVFPPFPEHKEFSIYASMRPAKEVGGDFYDFFFKDKDNIMFLVGDVSGKGVPAALFMMTVKTLINNLAQTIDSPEELVHTINNKIYTNNKQGFFLTLFAGIVNIHTGEMTCINCGHNPPLLKRNGGKYEYLNLEPNMVLGIFKEIDFQIYKTTLGAGDSIFLYTDGITEATNPEEELYGEERLEESINSIGDVSVEEIVNQVRDNVRAFIKDHGQSDDATTLLFKYNKTLRTIEKPAVKENYKEFNTWLRSTCSEWNLNDDLTNKLDMCGEEIFANICFYAYPESVGNIKVSLEKNEKELTMQFEDSGVMYNPLEKPDPDLTIPPKERKLGGLGIYMVKQMAKEMKYQRTNNMNVLSLKFDI